jgi:hypothetical protein
VRVNKAVSGFTLREHLDQTDVLVIPFDVPVFRFSFSITAAVVGRLGNCILIFLLRSPKLHPTGGLYPLHQYKVTFYVIGVSPNTPELARGFINGVNDNSYTGTKAIMRMPQLREGILLPNYVALLRINV